MRSAVLGFGLAVVAVVFGLAAANPPIQTVPEIKRAQATPVMGPRASGQSPAVNSLRRMWVRELLGMSSSGSAKTSSSVSGSASQSCSDIPDTLVLSGAASGTLILEGMPDRRRWALNGNVGGCPFRVFVDCIEDVLTGDSTLYGIVGDSVYTVISVHPLLIEGSFTTSGTPPECSVLLGQDFTISE